ncbi:hypothetical protein GF312_03530, partial [Candidatus Poribacteria bacterium]|nr:hypothetical protein [Candidatus Poribacteria bacterium]
MEPSNHHKAGSPISRRTALKLTLAATLTPSLSALKVDSPAISQVNVIRIKKKSGEDVVLTYLEVITDNDVSGYGGPLLNTQAQS